MMLISKEEPTTMFARITIALSAALMFAAATTAVATAKGQAANPHAAFALSGPVAVRALSPVQHDSSGAAIFRRSTPGCTLSLMQQSRC